MTSPTLTAGREPAGAASSDGAITTAVVATWVGQLARTLKTCRLYDGENPTVIKFREDTARDLARLLTNGTWLTLHFTSTDVVYGEASVYAARSREDNLARPFFRDGISSITFHAGIEAAQVERFFDQILRVTAANATDEDLVTLLWDAEIPHLEFHYVPTVGEGDLGTEGGASGDEIGFDARADDRGRGDAGAGASGGAAARAALIPWPAAAPASTVSAAPPAAAGGERDLPGRSDDWQTSEAAVDIAAAFARLDSIAAAETERFRREIEAEAGETSANGALRVIADSLAAGPTREDCLELGQVLPRVLLETTRTAQWNAARTALVLLRQCKLPDWSTNELTRALLGDQANLTPQCIAALDQQSPEEIEAFLAFAKELGPDGTEWLMTILAQSQQKRVRRPLTKVIAELCRAHPERLRHWMSNPQWYVVRNVVHILGWIGGAGIVRLLREAATHDEPRVRQEVVAALGAADASEARPILLRLLDTADGRVLSAVLHQLSGQRDPAVAKKLLEFVLDPALGQRPAEEMHLIFVALANCAGDEALPALETKLSEGGWLSRSPDAYRRALASCIARIGTPKALETLRRGANARRPAIRIACEEALTKSRGTD